MVSSLSKENLLLFYAPLKQLQPETEKELPSDNRPNNSPLLLLDINPNNEKILSIQFPNAIATLQLNRLFALNRDIYLIQDIHGEYYYGQWRRYDSFLLFKVIQQPSPQPLFSNIFGREDRIFGDETAPKSFAVFAKNPLLPDRNALNSHSGIDEWNGENETTFFSYLRPTDINNNRTNNTINKSPSFYLPGSNQLIRAIYSPSNATSSTTIIGQLEIVDFNRETIRSLPLLVHNNNTKNRSSSSLSKLSTNNLPPAILSIVEVPPNNSTKRAGDVVILLDNNQVLLYELDIASLQNSQQLWRRIVGQSPPLLKINNNNNSNDKNNNRKTPPNPSGAKEGEVDDEEHFGGSNFKGGSGGSDTAGMGGRGGPYRQASNFPVQQVRFLSSLTTFGDNLSLRSLYRN